ncbi:hypothetical protein CEXT_724121 [Caerostris extrusa]|uniref:Uncharacterized protein n=1 Tax=Caerostris extrusa TaxID=172846 RepID=A0AAV4QPS4_CAEEX|nr:hypothetical protein CEXT_724121 [Caerostris extrusa]
MSRDSRDVTWNAMAGVGEGGDREEQFYELCTLSPHSRDKLGKIRRLFHPDNRRQDKPDFGEKNLIICRKTYRGDKYFCRNENVIEIHLGLALNRDKR